MYGETTGGGPQYNPGYALERLAEEKRLYVPTVRERVAERVAAMKKALAEHEALLAILDKNPGIEEVLDAIRKIGV